MSQAISNRQSSETQLDQQACMAVPKIMNPDRLQPGQLSHSFYLVEQIAFRKIEKALFWGDGNAAEYDTDLERALYMGHQIKDLPNCILLLTATV